MFLGHGIHGGDVASEILRLENLVAEAPVEKRDLLDGVLGFGGAQQRLRHRLGPPRGQEGVLVGEQELVPGGAAKHRHFLPEYRRLENLRRVLLHPVGYVFLRPRHHHVDVFSDHRPAGGPRRDVWFRGVGLCEEVNGGKGHSLVEGIYRGGFGCWLGNVMQNYTPEQQELIAYDQPKGLDPSTGKSVVSYHGYALLPLLASKISSIDIAGFDFCRTGGEVSALFADASRSAWIFFTKVLKSWKLSSCMRSSDNRRSTLSCCVLLGVSHLKACEVQSCIMASQHPCYGAISVSPQQLTYIDRLDFKGNKIQRISPAVTSWTEEKVRERIKSEVKSGQFGRGKVIPRFEREEERVHERIDENVQAELSDESLKKVTSVLRKMADTVVEFGEVMAEIGNSRTGGGIIKRTFENIVEMINGVSSSQPPQQQGLLDDDDIFNQPSFLDAVSALEQAFLQTRKNYAAQPEQPTTSQSQHHIQTPSFDLGVPSPQPAAMEQPQNKIDSTELRNIARDLDEDSEKTISDEQQLDTTPEDNTMKQLFDRTRRFKNLPMNLRSPFWTKNDEILKKVGSKEKLISDYAFLDPTEERPLTEQLFEYAGYYLDRETFQSMRAGELESVIVDVWCLRLNQLDLNRGLDKPKRIFFSTQAFIQLDSPTNWEKGENAEQSSYQTDFEQCLDTEINNVGKLDISDAQLDPYLASLRALYTSRILMMPVNVHKATVIRNAEEHFIGKRLLQ
nr:uncharacterized protein LOC109179062 [Ipomoea batatas]